MVEEIIENDIYFFIRMNMEMAMTFFLCSSMCA